MDRRYEARLGELLSSMKSNAVEYLWVEPSVDFFYLTGIETISLERLTGLLVDREGNMRALVPELLVDDFDSLAGAEMATWSDGEGPSSAVAHVLRDVDRVHVQGSLPMWAAEALRSARAGLDLAVDAGSIARLREHKDPEEAEALRRSARVTDDVMTWVAEQEVDGLTERAFSGRIKGRYLELGHLPADWALVASGPNAAIGHHAGDDTAIDTTKPLLTDFGARVGAYWSDTTRVHFPREVEPELERVWDVVCAAYDAAFATVAVGTPCSAVDRAARSVIEDAGYGEHFTHRTGHGIGLEVHEAPYMTATNDAPLEVGHAFTIEPGVYLTGRWGLRYENVVYLGPEGPEALNATPRRHSLR